LPVRSRRRRVRESWRERAYSAAWAQEMLL
jgi:hypothetical protein